jgi:hypothetical protein
MQVRTCVCFAHMYAALCLCLCRMWGAGCILAELLILRPLFQVCGGNRVQAVHDASTCVLVLLVCLGHFPTAFCAMRSQISVGKHLP